MAKNTAKKLQTRPKSRSSARATVGTYEAKTHLPRLLEQVQEGSEFTITKHGVPVAQLLPIKPGKTAGLAEAIEKLKSFRKTLKLGEGISVRELIKEGRKR